MKAAETLQALVNNATSDDAPDLAAELARALATLLAKQRERDAIPPVPVPDGSAGLLTVPEAAARLGVASSWLYRHARALPFSRKLGHRTLRFDAKGLERWAQSRPSR